MKPKTSSSIAIFVTFASLIVAPAAQAANYFWDDNAAGTGFGTAGASTGTWAAPTAGPTAGWSLSGTGANAFASFTTATTDTVNFGNGATGLASGTITVSGTVATGNMTFASGSGAITLSGGTISLGGGRTITSNNTGNIISSELALTGATTFSIGEAGGAVTRQLTLGKLSGTGGTTFQYVGGSNGTGLIVLNAASTYTGTTLISTSLTNANTELRLGVDDALPTTTVLTIGGVQGTGSSPGRRTQLNLNGNDQTLAGLATTGGGNLRTQNILSSTAAILTIDGTSSNTFAGLIGNGGTNISIVKEGSGIQTLSGANTYVGLTTINGGALRVQHATGLGATSGDTVVNGTTTAGAANARLELAGNITVGAGESVTINGVGNFNGALTSASGNNIWLGGVTIGSAGTRIGATTGTSLEVRGVIDSGANPHGVIVRTANTTDSTVIFSGANTYLGNTQVLIGKLELAGGDNRLPVGTNLIFSSSTANGGAELDLNGRNQEVAGISISGGADVTLNGVNNTSATLSTLTVNTAASPSSHSGYLKGNLALEKTGANTLTLGGTNTYTGATTVNGGTLALGADGTIDDTSGVALGGGTFDVSAKAGGYTVNNLTGVGAVIGGLTVSTQLAIGTSPGTMSFESLSLEATATFTYEMNGGTSLADLGLVSDALSLGGATLSLVQLGTYTVDDKFTLFGYDGTLTGTFAGLADGELTTDNLGGTWQINYDDDSAGLNGGTGASFVTITAVPEPSASLLGILGALIALRRRRA